MAPVKPTKAQTLSRTQQINAISVTLSTIGNAIRSANDLTNEERLSLYIQLVTLSNAILALQTSGTQTETTTPTQRNENAEEGTLERLILKYNYNQPTKVEAIMHIATSSNRTAVFTYPQLTQYSSFGQRMSGVRQFGSYDVAERFAMTQGDVRRLTHITGRNPARDDAFRKNSLLANQLAEEFGVTSIVKNVNVYPGDKVGIIEIVSDQAETLTIEIKKNQTQRDPQGTNVDENKYSYRSTLKLADAFNLIEDDPREPSSGIIVDLLLQNVEKEDLLDLLDDLFGEHPLAREIEDYDNKILKFLLENQSYLLAGDMTRYTPADRNCFVESDYLISQELVKSLLVTMKFQHDPVGNNFKLLAPIVTQDGNYKECRNVRGTF